MITDRLVCDGHGSADHRPRQYTDEIRMEAQTSSEPEPDSPQEAVRGSGAATPSEVETRTVIGMEDHQCNNMLPNGHDYTYQLRSAPYRRLEHPTDKSLFLSFMGSIMFLIATLVLLGPALVVYVVFLPLGFVIKRCLAQCCCCAQNKVCACCYLQFLTEKDVFWLHGTENRSMVSQVLFTLEKGMNVARITDLVNAKLVGAEKKNGQKMFPRFVQKARRLYTGYVWINDNNFSIVRHIFSMPASVVDDASLARYISEQANQPLSMNKPLWEMHIHSNYGTKQETLVLLRIHPCLSDGISLVKIFFQTLISEEMSLNMKPRFGHVAFAFNCMRAFFIAPLVFLHKWLFKWKDQNLLHGPPQSGRKVVAWSKPFSLSKATRIKQVTRSTLNDILLTVSSGILRSYLQKQGVNHPYDLHSVIPVDFRSDSIHSVTMGNQMALVDIKLPTNTEGIIPRLWEVKHRMDEVKNSADPVVLYGMQWTLAYLLPEFFYRSVWSRILDKNTCFISSLQGPDCEVDIAMQHVKSMVTWMPLRSKIALSMSFMTYADQLCMSVIADDAIVPKPEALCQEFMQQMETLCELLSNRRIPGEHSGRRLDSGLGDDGSSDKSTIKDIQIKMREVQQQLQDLKSRLDIEAQRQYTMEERHLVSRVEELKEEFRELLAELRRKKASDGSVILSDDEDDEDGELRRSSNRKRSTSGNRRSLSSARPLTTQSSCPAYIRTSSPLHTFRSQSSSSSIPSVDQESAELSTPEHHSKVIIHEQVTAVKVEKKDAYSPQVERKC